MTYKTPDVYVEEISVFPPSVAEVETAIPAFIGYTERVFHKGVNNEYKAVQISSLVEFEEVFGDAPDLNVESVQINSQNTVEEISIKSTYYLYDSLRLFFSNGGGRCYVFSCGKYDTVSGNVDADHFDKCLKALAKEDEPTIILFPDAVKLDEDKLIKLQQDALAQAARLQDRFVVMDLQLDSEGESKYTEFRDKIGMKNLKYGAAYAPYVNASLPVKVKFNNFYDKVKKSGAEFSFSSQIGTGNDESKSFKSQYDNYVNVLSDYKAAVATLGAFDADFQKDLEEYKSAKTVDDFKALITHALKGVKFLVDTIGLSSKLADAGITKNNIPETAKTLSNEAVNFARVQALLQINKDLGKDADVAGGSTAWLVGPLTAYKFGDATVWTSNPSTVTEEAVSGANEAEKLANSLAGMIDAFNGISAITKSVIESVSEIENVLQTAIYEEIPIAANIAKAIAGDILTLPPSGAIAGVYADTDNKRGVWKAPANVSLSAVNGLTEKIDSETQESLNVDVTGGKSINAIREFAGRGILVWGARTLAGNDNEWRYVPVRRFFNMVEESIKKSTYWAVFEPNDANLWVKLKSMIENYLTQKWREGALAGAKPEQAFYVNVGLGKTMTAQDILEGRLVIDIGMAAVRPAEFIVLRFMHKMQEA